VNLPRGGCQNRFVTSEKETASKLDVKTQMEKNKREGKASMLVQNGGFKRSRMQQLLKDSLMRIIKKYL
jgi:hypothetical protein